MKKVFLMLALVLVGTMTFSGMMFAATEVNMNDLLTEAGKVKVYVGDVTDSSGDAGDMLAGIKKRLEDALATRMTIDFIIVSDKKKAALIVGCDVTEFVWMENDPVDQVGGLSSAALDVALRQNYARLQAKFFIKKGPEGAYLFKGKGKRIGRRPHVWEQTVKATVTKTIMPEGESKPLIEERIVEVFMRKCFAKNAKPIK